MPQRIIHDARTPSRMRTIGTAVFVKIPGRGGTLPVSSRSSPNALPISDYRARRLKSLHMAHARRLPSFEHALDAAGSEYVVYRYKSGSATEESGRFRRSPKIMNVKLPWLFDQRPSRKR